jgi:hypothetical protein
MRDKARYVLGGEFVKVRIKNWFTVTVSRTL